MDTINNDAEEPNKRKRTKVACDYCNRNRRKCNGENPCSECARVGITCTMNRIIGKRGPKPGYMENMERKIRLLESVLTKEQLDMVSILETEPMGFELLQKNESFHSQSSHLTSGQQFTFNIYSGQSESSIMSTVLPEFQIHPSELESVAAPIPLPPVVNLVDSIESKVQSVFETRAIQYDLIDFYFARLESRFPFLYKSQFINHIEQMKEYLLYGIYTLAMIHQPISCKGDAKRNELEAQAYFERALKLLKEEPEEKWDHYHVGTLILLHQYAQVTGQFEYLRELYADAYFKIIKLELNMDLVLRVCDRRKFIKVPYSETVRECRRRVFWTFFIYDVTMGYQIGCATLLSNDQIHCRLPMSDQDLDKIYEFELKFGSNYYNENIKMEPLPISNPLDLKGPITPSLFNYLIHLSQLIGIITKMNLDTVHLEVLSDGHVNLFSNVNYFLELWKSSFDSWLSLATSNSQQQKTSQETMIGFVLIFYYFAVTCLHRPRLWRNITFKSLSHITCHPSFIATHQAGLAVSKLLAQQSCIRLFSDSPITFMNVLFHMGLSFALLSVLIQNPSYRSQYLTHLHFYADAMGHFSLRSPHAKRKGNILSFMKNKLASDGFKQEDSIHQLIVLKKACTMGYPMLNSLFK